MYSVSQLTKMYKCTRQTMYTKLRHPNLQEYLTDDNGLKFRKEGLSTLNVVMAESRVKQQIDTQPNNPITPQIDSFVQKYITELERQVRALQDDKERLFFELQEQRKVLLLEAASSKKKWWQFWPK